MRIKKLTEQKPIQIGVYKDALYENYHVTIEDYVRNYPIFRGKAVQVTFFDYIGELQDKFHAGELDYMVMSCRDNRNNVSAHLLETINSMINRRVVEAGTFHIKAFYSDKKDFRKSPRLLPDTLDDKFGKMQINFVAEPKEVLSDDAVTDENVNDKVFSTDVDFKIFGKSEYKPSSLYKVLIACFANGVLNKFLSFCLLAIPIILIVIAPFMASESEQLVTAISAIAVAFVQFTVNVLSLDVKAKQCLIKGYWLYYSFEDGAADGSFVPNGFKTRLLEIDGNNDGISISCKFEADDTLFFHTTSTAFEYNSNTKIGSGFYEYSANAKNNKGKRAEGVCRFRGEAKNNLPFITMDGWFSSRGTQITGRVKYVRLSKKEYERLKHSSILSDNVGAQSVVKFGVYGDVCSNTELAAKEYISKNAELQSKEIELCYYESVEDMYNDFSELKLHYAIIPESNRNKKIERNSAFIKNNVEQLAGFDMEIHYVLASAKADFVEDENTLYFGHPQSLEQCREYLLGKKTHESLSSSRAAREVKYAYNPNFALAICNRQAMEHFGLYPIKDENGAEKDPYTNAVLNTTHFTVYRNKKK